MIDEAIYGNSCTEEFYKKYPPMPFKLLTRKCSDEFAVSLGISRASSQIRVRQRDGKCLLLIYR